MPSIRHHLTLAVANMTESRANLESALDHTISEHYDPRWTHAIDDTITAIANTTIQVHNVKTCIQPPFSQPTMPPCNLSTPHEG